MAHEKSIAHEGDLALMVSAQNKKYLINLAAGQQLQTHRGVVRHEDLIGKAWGTKVSSHLGSAYLLLQPSPADLLLEIKRNTQIMYPKDVGYALMMMDISPGKTVIEAGSGSGGLGTAIANAIGPEGRLYSYDNREQLQNLARKNIAKVGFTERVIFKVGDIANGFDEREVDAVFLDVPNPYDFLPQVRQALKSGGFFGSILPTVNQVSTLIHALRRNQFAFTEVLEIMLRYYKAVSDRLRPTDRMVAHTGYLIFSRPVLETLGDAAPEGEGTGTEIESGSEPVEDSPA